VDLNNIDTSKPFRLENQILIDFESYFEWPTLHNTTLTHNYCHGASSQIGILSDGRVVPCCLDSFGIVNFGNLKEDTLKDILNSSKAKNMIEGFKKSIAIEELCQKCRYKDRF
jgi:radical SAM protein with 4Fe4S-binding SPASM domain